MSQVTVIEIETRVKDETASGVASAQKNLSKLEQSFLKMQSAFTALSKGSFVEMTTGLEDQVSPLLEGISRLGEGLSGTAYQVILEGVDLVSSPLEALRESLSAPFSALVELATVGEVVPVVSEGAGGSQGAGVSGLSGTWQEVGASGGSGGGSEMVLESSVLATSSTLEQLAKMFSTVSSVGTSSEKDVSTWSETVGLSESSLVQSESSLYAMEQSLKQSEVAVSSFGSLVQETMGGLLGSGGRGSVVTSLGTFGNSMETMPYTTTQNSLETMTGSTISNNTQSLLNSMTGSTLSSNTQSLLNTTTGSTISNNTEHLLQNTTQNNLQSTAQSNLISTTQSKVQTSETDSSLFSERYSNLSDVFSLGSVSGGLAGSGTAVGEPISGVSGLTTQNQGSTQSNDLEQSVAVEGMFSSLFGETLSSKLEEFSSTVEESISSSLVLAQEPITATVQGFFTEHLPSVMEEFFSSQVTALEEVGVLAHDLVGEQMGVFWQEEVPALFDGFWGSCAQGLTEGEALALESVLSGVQLFWNEELPTLFQEFWSRTGEHLHESSTTALEEVATGVEGFFGEVIPTSLEELWSSSEAKILETSLVTQTVIDLGISSFFGEVIPSSVRYIWDGATTTLEAAKVASLASVSAGISGFFTSSVSSINGFFSSAQSKISAAVTAANASLARLSVATASASSSSNTSNISSSSSTSASYGGSSIAAYANGGILSAPHVGLVAEDGPEAIIPLSGKRRSRGLALWEEAGRALGVTPYAQGGLVGSGLKGLEQSGETVVPLSLGDTGGDGKQSGSKSEGVTVSLGQVNFNVKLDDCRNPEEVLTLFKEKIGECTEEIALSLARSLERSFENMPLYNC